nr:unnamed protein product [Callosobruchus chinensis]
MELQHSHKVFEEIESRCEKSITSNEASGIRRALEDPEFIFWLELFHKILPQVDILYNQLQSKNKDTVQLQKDLIIFEKIITYVPKSIISCFCPLRNTRVCYRCTKSTSTYETEGILNLSMRSLELCRLEELMHDYLCDYLVSDFSCQECNSTMTIVNKRRVVVEPEVLVIALKRYICNERMEP